MNVEPSCAVLIQNISTIIVHKHLINMSDNYPLHLRSRGPGNEDDSSILAANLGSNVKSLW